jgi:integrase/recombinase XerD
MAGFYRYAVEEELLEHSPALHVRRPRVDYESHATALDRNEVGALLVAAGLGPRVSTPSSHCSLLTACERLAGLGGHWDQHRGARTRAGPSDPHRPAQGREGGDGPAGAAHCPRHRPRRRPEERRTGLRRPRWAAPRPPRGRPVVRRVARRAGITKPVGPHTLRHAFITAALDAGVPLRDVQEAASHADPRTITCATTGPGCRLTATPPTWWPPSSPG